MTSNTPPPAVSCAERIALLYFLHSVPDPPSRNPIDRLPIREIGYTLSLLRERSLVGTLAFLSNLKDGPEHIPAVCVEENPDSASLKVLIAVNKASPGDGEGVLQDLKSGFERIFEVLSQVSARDCSPLAEDRVFSAIISMCSSRILCRLRLIPNNKSSSRQPIKELLQMASKFIRGLKKRFLQERKLLQTSTLFVERVKEVIKLIDAWAGHHTPARLLELVDGMHHLWRVGELHDLLSTMPNQIMDPSSRKALLNTISKVARYREAARFLYRTAKKIPIVRQMHICLINLPQDVFQRIPAEKYTPTVPSTIASTISQISTQHGRRWNVGHICLLLGVNQVDASHRLAQQTQKTLKDAKIHAEIQLLFYCELNPSELPPRVICSTKDACFLCNAFILMHGKIYTPRCHGRLYTAWRLPLSPEFEELEQRFNLALEYNIRNSLTTLFARKKKTVYPDPNESTLLTLPHSASTLSSLTSSVAVNEEDGGFLPPQTPNFLERDSDPPIASNPELLSEQPESKPGDDLSAPIGEIIGQPSNEIASQTVLSDLSSSLGSSSESTSCEDYALLQGQTLSKCIKADRSSPLYTAGPLEVQIEYSTGQDLSASNSHLSNLAYSLEWLTVDEAERALEQSPAFMFDAESLEGEISHKVDDLKTFYITARGSILKILLQSKITGEDSST